MEKVDLKDKGNPPNEGQIRPRSTSFFKRSTEKNYHLSLLGLIQKSLSIHHILEIKSVLIQVEQQLQDPRYTKLIEKYQDGFLVHGWKVFLNSVITYVLITSVLMVLSPGASVIELIYVLTLRILLVTSIISIHLYAYHNQVVKNYIILVLWTLVNLLLVYETIPLDTPTTYEFWYLNMIMWFMISIIYCFSWKKVVASFMIQKTIVILSFYFLGKKIPKYYYMVVAIKFIAYPIICLILCKLVLNFIVTLHQNTVLIETTKHILEVFPKAVIIRGDPNNTGGNSDLFTNFAAKNHIIGKESNPPKYILPKPNDQCDEDTIDRNFKDYSEILDMRENEVNDKEQEDLITEQVYPKMWAGKPITQDDIRYFSIKTVKVEWID